jgi:hypothetical protein
MTTAEKLINRLAAQASIIGAEALAMISKLQDNDPEKEFYIQIVNDCWSIIAGQEHTLGLMPDELKE